ESLRRMLFDRDLVLLLGSLLVGYLLGPTVAQRFDFIITAPFEFMLSFFLLNMGLCAGKQIAQIKASGGKLIAFGVFTPAIGAGLGIVIGGLANLQMGDIIILGTLAASASYVAAPAVMGRQVPARAIATSLAVSLGVTLPWNILIGIPIYTSVARMTMNTGARGSILLVAFLALAGAATIWIFRRDAPVPAKRAVPFAKSVPNVVGYVDHHSPRRFDPARGQRRDLRLPRARDDPRGGVI
ncbi:MAG: sodium-dependent bicarbonate transport family permease, partial [Chloroflexota bacterium]